MQLSTILLSALVVVAHAAPTDPKLRLKDLPYPAVALDQLSEYFNLLANKVQLAKVANVSPICDLSKAQMPTAPTALPPVSPGLKLHHVAVGRGTQNYTCSSSDDSAIPAAQGAVATLFNASCAAALYPDMLAKVPAMAVHFDLNDAEKLGPAALQVSGHHYFTNLTTAFFDLNPSKMGQAPCAKTNATDAPSTAAVGVGGEKAVPWLKLAALDGATEELKEVYRVETAGGSPPATCKGMASTFQVQYSAQYWFYAGEITEPKDS
jgi:hypothetical protein